MLDIKVGIHLASLRLPLLKGLAVAARLGAQAVEIDARGELRPAELTQTALRQMRKTLNDFQLRVCAVSYRTRRGYGVLDDLDARFIAHGWSFKWLHREIMLSAAYRQASQTRADAELADPVNSLLWRMNPQRLDVR